MISTESSGLSLMVLAILLASAMGCEGPKTIDVSTTSHLFSDTEDYTKWVNPMIGTAKMGHTYPGATVPYGMVQLTPQTHFEPIVDTSGSYNPATYPYCAGY